MRIYKIRAMVTKTKYHTEVYFYKVIIIDNFSTALKLFYKQIQTIETWKNWDEHIGSVQVFIPHVNKDGKLTDWPNNNKYLRKYSF